MYKCINFYPFIKNISNIRAEMDDQNSKRNTNEKFQIQPTPE